MKKRTMFGVLMSSMLMMSSSWAYFINDPDALTYDGTDVGQVDKLLGEADLKNYNEGTETDWVNSILSETIVELGVHSSETIPYYNTSWDESETIVSDTVFAFGTIAPTDYFTIKQGDYIALFENNDKYDWGVFDTSLLDSTLVNLPTDDYTISHYTMFTSTGDTPTIAEPTTLALMGMGLVGFGLVKRKRQ